MFTVYSTPTCPECEKAKLLLDMKEIAYTVKVAGVDFTREELQELAPGRKSFPVIFKNDTLIGGLPELKTAI